MTVREILTTDNAPRVKSVQSISNPEWGVWQFEFEGQPLPEGRYTHIISKSGFGNAQVLDDDEFKFYEVVEFKEEEQSDMLSLFNDIEVVNTKRISGVDKEFCDSIQGSYNRTMEQLTSWLNKFKESAKMHSESLFKIEDYGSVTKKYSHNSSTDETMRGFEFSPLYDILHIEKLIKQATTYLESSVISYFNKKYSTRIENKNLLVELCFGKEQSSPYRTKRREYKGVVPTYDPVLDYIFDALGGKSFNEMAISIIEEDIKELARYYGTEIKGSTLNFPNFIRYSWYGSSYEVDYENSAKVDKVLVALVLFSTGELISNVSIICNHNRTMTVGEEYPLTNSIATSVKFFKNGRMDLKFKDKQSAFQFQERFQLFKQR